MESLKTCYELFSREHEHGWDKLVDPIVEFIEKWNSEHPNDEDKIIIDQIKEKWSLLDFHVSNVPHEISDILYNMIREAERKSGDVCERCGSEENVGTVLTGWFRTICEKCVKDCVEHPQNEGIRYRAPEGVRWQRHSDSKVFRVFKKDSGDIAMEFSEKRK